ncbi:MAG: MerR family transcriptional regulator [Rhizomicrobium sp.]
MTDAYLSPVEAARRLGVSAKALRLYEKRGLVKPLRNGAGWRAYGPAHIARLHQVLALKSLGLPLARIAELLSGRLKSLDALLALQEQVLARESSHVTRALTLVRQARAKLAQGETLSIDDLTTLTTETTMTAKATPEEMKAIFAPIFQKHFTAEEQEALRRKKAEHPDAAARWDALVADAKALMAKGDPGSPEAQNLARRWKAMNDQLSSGDPVFARKFGVIWQEAMADPNAAPKLPFSPELFAFVDKAIAKLKEQSG